MCLVVAISDGDTITVRCGQPDAYEQVKIRLSAIDAPEKRQPFGNVSRQHLARLCFQQLATITAKSRDRYGRMIADVECNGKDASAYQVDSGLAWFYVRYGKGYEHLAELEIIAKHARLGVWSAEAVPPWEWRRNSKRQR